MNKVILIGRLTRDLDLKYTASGTAVANFHLAIDKEMSKEDREKAEQNGESTAVFIPVTIWGKLAESCSMYMGKGSQCAVSGRLQPGSYVDKDSGKTIYTMDVVAENIEFLSDSNRERREAKWKN
ncbi:single-stranded DNA-binding protein [Anaerococcus lactolyticus]|uniref:single-stranded DNA-binding protein n=1 Tax=Anaerococcus lactolyticus TaxID=33032 RepID=UPI002889C168|nr:single-stranded DNA-binding protein [Anaerococcus lactolyticus]